MSRLVRFLLVWVLVALLPLQGYAAAAMISCGPMHAEQAAKAQEFHHSHGAQHSGHQHQHHESAGTSAADSGDSSPTLPDLLKFKCSACAACCTGSAAPSPSMPFVSPTKAHAIVSLFFDWSDHSIVPPGLERPPRTALV
jgi:hypothetical protein